MIKAAPTTQPTTQPAVAEAKPVPQPMVPVAAPVAVIGVREGAAQQPAVPLAVLKPKYPLVTLRKFDVNLRKVTFTDETQTVVNPLTIADLHFFANKPIEVLGPEAANRPPVELGLTLKVEKVLDNLTLAMHLSPFAGEPVVVADVTGSGLHGDGLLSLAPELKDTIDASKLTEGHFHAHAGVKAKLDRFDPLDFNPTRAFDVDVLLKDVEFRDHEKGAILIGVEEIRSEGIHVHPITGKVLVKALEVNNITGVATREKDGIHAVGVVLKISAAPATRPSGPSTQPAAVAKADVPPAGAQKPPTVVNEEDESEIKINRVSVNGLNLHVEDNTVAPPLVVPLAELDLEVQNLSSRAMTEVRPKTRFSMLVGAGRVLLPRKGVSAVGVATETPSGRKLDPLLSNLEERDLFSQIQLDGELVFYPALKGWIKTTVSAFDLAALSSEAKTFGVTLGGGVFDASIDARLPGDGSERTDSHFTVTDLDLSEPANGPIQSILRFPAPLNIVIGALEGADGSIDLPLPISIHQGNLSTEEMVGAGVHALGSVVITAIAAAPLKAASVVVNLIPFVGGKKEPKRKNRSPLPLPPGMTGCPVPLTRRLAGYFAGCTKTLHWK